MEKVFQPIRTFVSNTKTQLVALCIIAIVFLIGASYFWGLFPSHRDLLIGTIASFVASFLAVFVALCLDRQTRAKLEIDDIPEEEDNEEKSLNRKFLHVNVTNPPLTGIHSFFQDRHTASGTWAEIEFYLYPDTTAQELPEPTFTKPMPGKWRESQIPKLDDYKESKQLPRGYLDTRDIPSGKGIRNHLDIAMKISGEEVCYGYNLECELYRPLLYNPERKLEGEHYLVIVTVTTAGKAVPDYFELFNSSDYSSFKLRKVKNGERKRITRLHTK